MGNNSTVTNNMIAEIAACMCIVSDENREDNLYKVLSRTPLLTLSTDHTKANIYASLVEKGRLADLSSAMVVVEDTINYERGRSAHFQA